MSSPKIYEYYLARKKGRPLLRRFVSLSDHMAEIKKLQSRIKKLEKQCEN